MTNTVRVLGLSGSLRRESLNTAVLLEMAELTPPEVHIERLEYGDVPLYNTDLGEVASVEAARRRVADADAVLIVTPEYNYGIPGPLKNVLDWLSRPAYRSVFAHKPVGTLSVAPGAIGGARGQAHLKLVLGSMVCQLFPHPEVAINNATTRVQAGKVVDESTRALLTAYLEQFATWVRRVGG